MNDRCIKAAYLLSPLSQFNNPEYTRQFKLVRDPDSNRVNDHLKNKTMPVSLYDKLLTFRDIDGNFELNGDLLKRISNNNYNVDLAKSSGKKFLFKFARKRYFDDKALGKKSTRDKSPIRLLQSPGSKASGISTIFLPENLIEVCDRLKLLLQEK